MMPPIVEIAPTEHYPKPRRLAILEIRSSYGEGGPIDECLVQIIGTALTPAWVSVAGLRPLISTGKIIN